MAISLGMVPNIMRRTTVLSVLFYEVDARNH